MKRITTLFVAVVALALIPTFTFADGRYRGGGGDHYSGGYRGGSGYHDHGYSSYHDHGYGYHDHGYGSHSSFGVSFGFGGGYYDRGYYAPRYVESYRPYYAPTYYRPVYVERYCAPVRYYSDCDYGYYRPTYYRPYSAFSFSFGYRGRW